MKLTGVISLAAALVLAGCGRETDLKPAKGESLPVKPLMAKTTPTPNDLLTIPSYAKPGRVDDLMKRSEPRPQDPFDLPPPTGGSAPSLPPGSEIAPTSNQPQNSTQPAPGMPVTPPPSPGD
ncbi:MAG TPA: hypothetical protein VE820_09740 [Sphingomicrobium sp.]|jgi:hypothetical protein|nr:hypothetical protein [Sphingomicrobium sp.]